MFFFFCFQECQSDILEEVLVTFSCRVSFFIVVLTHIFLIRPPPKPPPPTPTHRYFSWQLEVINQHARNISRDVGGCDFVDHMHF